jgi:hypothetical protein
VNFGRVRLGFAKVTEDVKIVGAHFDGELSAYSLQVGGSLSISSVGDHDTTFTTAKLRGANIAGNVEVSDLKVADGLDASRLQVGGRFMSIRAMSMA